MALEINFAEWTVLVFDPDINFIRERQLTQLLKLVTHVLPTMFAVHQEMHAKHKANVARPLTLTRVKGIPQNKQS